MQYKYVCYTNKQGKPKTHSLLHISSPTQAQGGCETNLRLSTKARRRPFGYDLVKISSS